MTSKKIPPIHIGEILEEEFLKPMRISQECLAKDIQVSEETINEIVNRKRGITKDIALRLAKYFNMSSEFWLGLQKDCDLDSNMKGSLSYKGYTGSIHYSDEDNVFYGKIEGIRDLVSYEGNSVEDLREALS